MSTTIPEIIDVKVRRIEALMKWCSKCGIFRGVKRVVSASSISVDLELDQCSHVCTIESGEDGGS